MGQDALFILLAVDALQQFLLDQFDVPIQSGQIVFDLRLEAVERVDFVLSESGELVRNQLVEL